MKCELAGVLAVLLTATMVLGEGEDAFYKLGPDSLVQEGAAICRR